MQVAPGGGTRPPSQHPRHSTVAESRQPGVVIHAITPGPVDVATSMSKWRVGVYLRVALGTLVLDRTQAAHAERD